MLGENGIFLVLYTRTAKIGNNYIILVACSLSACLHIFFSIWYGFSLIFANKQEVPTIRCSVNSRNSERLFRMKLDRSSVNVKFWNAIDGNPVKWIASTKALVVFTFFWLATKLNFSTAEWWNQETHPIFRWGINRSSIYCNLHPSDLTWKMQMSISIA